VVNDILGDELLEGITPAFISYLLQVTTSNGFVCLC
jgi:hypothetical protein